MGPPGPAVWDSVSDSSGRPLLPVMVWPTKDAGWQDPRADPRRFIHAC